MKNIKLLSAVLVLFTAFNFVSCSDVEPVDPAVVIPSPEPNPNPNPNPTPGTFKVDIDGQPYTATTTMVYISGGSIILNAINAQGNNFGMILGGTTPGTYPTNEDLVAYTQAGSEFGWWGYHPTDNAANTGAVIVTSVDNVNHTISGTFQYTGYWSDDSQTVAPKQFTNGIFTNLPYTVQNPTGDTFFAKVNGVDYVDTDILVAEISIGTVDVYSIGTEDAEGQGITVSVKTTLGVGTYPINGSLEANGVQIQYTPVGDTFGDPVTSGTVTITEKTASRIKGSFSGTVVIDTVTYQITAGTFDVELP